MSADLLFILHDDKSTAGTTLDWCARRNLTPKIIVASRLKYALPLRLRTLPAVIFGGDMQVWETSAYPWLKLEKQVLAERIALGIPSLGLCLGAQLLAEQLGSQVRAAGQSQIGWYPVVHAEPVTPLHWHNSEFTLPKSLTKIASDANGTNQGFQLTPRILGFQFHAEIDRVRLAHVCKNWAPSGNPLAPDKEAIESEGERRMPALRAWYFRRLDEWRRSWM